jgi:hypothetical protein
MRDAKLSSDGANAQLFFRSSRPRREPPGRGALALPGLNICCTTDNYHKTTARNFVLYTSTTKRRGGITTDIELFPCLDACRIRVDRIGRAATLTHSREVMTINCL